MSNINNGTKIETYARKSQGSNVDSYRFKYCAVSIPKQTIKKISKVFIGVKNRVQMFSAYDV